MFRLAGQALRRAGYLYDQRRLVRNHGIHADGTSSTAFFTQLADPDPDPVAGALLVYPDYVGADGKSHDGHIGVVLEAGDKGIKGVQRVIHCSLGNFKKSGDAVQVTGPQAWAVRPNSIIVWLDGMSA